MSISLLSDYSIQTTIVDRLKQPYNRPNHHLFLFSLSLSPPAPCVSSLCELRCSPMAFARTDATLKATLTHASLTSFDRFNILPTKCRRIAQIDLNDKQFQHKGSKTVPTSFKFVHETFELYKIRKSWRRVVVGEKNVPPPPAECVCGWNFLTIFQNDDGKWRSECPTI